MTPAGPPQPPTLEYDLSALAENGLRRGFTTGTSATAATKAALTLLVSGILPDSVAVTLPDGLHFLPIPISAVPQEPGWAAASVIKEAGDDPDQTHRARIISRVRWNGSGRLAFLRGAGVGMVTKPGLRLPIGDPAINAVPRAMIRRAVGEVLGTEDEEVGLDVEVGCENGEAIAMRTFNPRLGIVGGISILGTTGIVEPKSLASFMASIEVYIRVALGGAPDQIVLSPGNLGQRFAKAQLGLPIQQIVQMSNFAGHALDCVSQTLAEGGRSLPLLWLVGHPGKLAKLIAGVWDTHSHRSAGAMEALLSVAKAHTPGLFPLLSTCESTEAAIEKLAGHPEARAFWSAAERAIAAAAGARVRHVGEVRVRLFSMEGAALGEAASEETP